MLALQIFSRIIFEILEYRSGIIEVSFKISLTTILEGC